jgi:hypothetical protein
MNGHLSAPETRSSEPSCLLSNAYANILFVLAHAEDADGSGLESALMCTARRFAEEKAYVYIARAGQNQLEDDVCGVRYLPLDPAHPPCFGTLTKALVMGNKLLALAIAAEHPEAEVFLVAPSGGLVQAKNAPCEPATARLVRPVSDVRSLGTPD